jgi:peroxiredoxin
MVRTASTMLPLGTSAPDFSLTDSEGKIVSLGSLRGAKALVIVFMCNHCPYVKHIAPELSRVSKEYQAKGVVFVGINSNDAQAYPDDSAEMMKIEAERQGYGFPYLFDATQEVAKAYRAACTPDFFVFDANQKLVYRGQLDDSRPKTDRPLTGKDLREALESLLAGKPVSSIQKPSIGCNIKWKPESEPDYFDPAGVAG